MVMNALFVKSSHIKKYRNMKHKIQATATSVHVEAKPWYLNTTAVYSPQDTQYLQKII